MSYLWQKGGAGRQAIAAAVAATVFILSGNVIGGYVAGGGTKGGWVALGALAFNLFNHTQNKVMKHFTIVSGGQVGVDEGALRGAKLAGLKTSGSMPKGFSRSGGGGAEFAKLYGLSETCYGKGTNADRDRENVDGADLLVAFLVDKPMTGRGTRGTIAYAYCGEHNHEMAPPQAYQPRATPVFIKASGPLEEPDLTDWTGPIDILLIWDLDEENWKSHADFVANAIREHGKDYNGIMFSGPMEQTSPGITHLVEMLVCRTFTQLLGTSLGTI